MRRIGKGCISADPLEIRPEYIVLRAAEVEKNEHLHGGPLFPNSEDRAYFEHYYQMENRLKQSTNLFGVKCGPQCLQKANSAITIGCSLSFICKLDRLTTATSYLMSLGRRVMSTVTKTVVFTDLEGYTKYG